MIDSALLTECEEMACSIAPELRANPLYCVDASIFDGLPEARSDCLGWAYRQGVLVNIPLAERIDEWKGPGPIVCLCEDNIRDEYGDDFDSGLRETMTHEIAHIVPVIPFVEIGELADIPAETVRAHQLTKLATAATKPQCAAMHDHRFIRRILHVWFRAISAGWDVPIYRLFGPDCESFLQPPHYLAALMTELTAMQSATFAEIEGVCPPLAFSRLWERSHGLHGSIVKESP